MTLREPRELTPTVVDGARYSRVSFANTVMALVSAMAGLDGLVGCGADHASVPLSDSHVVCWGHNSTGQLGDGTRTDSISTPVQVQGLQ